MKSRSQHSDGASCPLQDDAGGTSFCHDEEGSVFPVYRHFVTLLEVLVCQPFKWLGIWFGAIIAQWWLGCPEGIRVIMAVAGLFYVLDWVSGVMCAICRKTPDGCGLTSRRLREALVKFFNYVVVLLFGVGIDSVAGMGYIVTGGLAALILLTEGLSVIENTKRLGFVYPPFFERWFEKLCQQQSPMPDDPEVPRAKPSAPWKKK